MTAIPQNQEPEDERRDHVKLCLHCNGVKSAEEMQPDSQGEPSPCCRACGLKFEAERAADLEVLLKKWSEEKRIEEECGLFYSWAYDETDPATFKEETKGNPDRARHLKREALAAGNQARPGITHGG